MRCEKDEGTKGLRDLETVNGESLRKSAGFPSAIPKHRDCENFLNFHVIICLGNIVKLDWGLMFEDYRLPESD